MLNIQTDLRERLESALEGVPVRVAVPADRPTPLVVVRRDGGSRDTHSILDRPTIIINAWAETEAKSANLAEQIALAIAQMPFSGGYATVEQNAMRSDYDTVAQCPRWVLSYSFTTYKPKE